MNNKTLSVEKPGHLALENAGRNRQAACDLADLTQEMSAACPDEIGALQKISANILPDPLSVMIVGQVKVGKSKFLNGLTGRGGLLPSDVNPLTTVLTHLHFNHTPDRQSGADFHFYNPQEWQALTQPDANEPKQIHEHAEQLVSRAQTRFGNHLPDLLGATHQFNPVTPEVLAQYVSSGQEGAEQYDDLIRAADVCFSTAPFPGAIRFTDTPGVNDPCLIRDKITWAAIGDADYYLVILSAHQAMSRMDEALLKVLKEKGSGRAVIFINRIDELSNCVRDAKLLQRSVQNDITRIFGGAPAAVLCGSAQWAHVAETGEGTDALREKAEAWVEANPTLKRQLETGLAKGEHTELYQEEMAVPRYQALVASGIPQLRRFFSKILLNRFDALNTEEQVGEVLEIAERHLGSVRKVTDDTSDVQMDAHVDEVILDEVGICLEEEQALLALQLHEDIDALRGELVAGYGASDPSPSAEIAADPEAEIPLPDELENLRLNFISGIQSVKLDLIAGIQHSKEGLCASFPDFLPLQKTETDSSILRRFSPDTRILWREAAAMVQASWASRLFHRKHTRPSADAVVNELLEAAETALLSHTDIVFRHYLAAISGNLPDEASKASDNSARILQAEAFVNALRELQKNIDINPHKMDQSQ